MNHRWRWTQIAFLLWGLTAPLTASSRVEELFQKALVKESVERDLDGAIHLYQQVIDQSPKDPATAAEARLRMGICFEKLDKPEYAEAVYHQILDEQPGTPIRLGGRPSKAKGSGGVPPDIAQQARTNLRRIEAEKRQVVVSSEPARGAWAKRLSLLIGPSLLSSSNGMPVYGLSAGLRFRISPEDRPLSWFLDARGTAPLGNSDVGNQGNVFDSQGTDNATLSLKYQALLGLVGELPHGQQQRAIPEVGAGLALTSAKISYSNATSAGDMTQTTWSPYVHAGLHVFPDKVVSILFQINYVLAPYPKSVDFQSPAHSQTYDFPSSLWDIGAMLQIKLGYFSQRPQR